MPEDGLGVADLPFLHTDPFDRLLIIQAKLNEIRQISIHVGSQIIYIYNSAKNLQFHIYPDPRSSPNKDVSYHITLCRIL